MKTVKNLLIYSIVLFVMACGNETEKPNKNTDLIADSVKNELAVAPWKGCMVSAYLFKEDGRHLPDNYAQQISDFESLIDHEIGSLLWYPTFADEFPLVECQALTENGIIPHLTWEMFVPDEVDYNTMPMDSAYYMTDEVLNGKYDEYIKRFAQGAKLVNGPVMIRFLHEFNGNWYLWSGNKNGRENGGPEKVVAVWKYVVDIFKEAGADNVQWIWNAHGPSTDVSEEAWNAVANYWPGNDYVDWIGMDAYNWYPKDPWGGERPYRNFDNCFRNLYDECTKLGDQPVMIAEFGTPEFEYEGQNKAYWITDALKKMKTEYPRIKLFVWFHINKELDWRINSSPEALEAFKKAVSDDYFIGKANK